MTDTLRQAKQNWLSDDLTLVGDYVSLEPMTLQHIDELNAAAADGELWRLAYTDVPTAEQMPKIVEGAIAQRQKGNQFPFVVRRLSDKRLVGSTRYYFISQENRNLSIGYTWYAASVQRTAVNTECKLLLLSYAFEDLDCISVQWHTHHENIRSQQAILRLGAKREGVLRNQKILPDGSIRHTHCFSMLDEEWPASKAFLQERLARYA